MIMATTSRAPRFLSQTSGFNFLNSITLQDFDGWGPRTLASIFIQDRDPHFKRRLRPEILVRSPWKVAC